MRPARCKQLVFDVHLSWSEDKLDSGVAMRYLVRQKSMTTLTVGIVTLFSAMLVLKMIFGLLSQANANF